MGRPSELRLLTYLAPGLPLALFQAVADELERVLALPCRLASDPTRSAPEPGGDDPFAAGQADLGFLCAPGYGWLAAKRPSSVELVPAAFVFDDPRLAGRPRYFADLVVPLRSRAEDWADLAGSRWVYNDPCSLSGYFSVLQALRARGRGPEFFGSARAVGSHHAALQAVASGAADCAAIDSNTLLLARRAGAPLGVRVLESFGPFAVQPVVVRRALPAQRKAAIAAALLAMHRHAPARAALAACGVRRFAPVAPADYAGELELLACPARA